MLSSFFIFRSLCDLALHCILELTNRIVPVPDYLLLPHKEQVALYDVQEEAEVDQGLTDAVVG